MALPVSSFRISLFFLMHIHYHSLFASAGAVYNIVSFGAKADAQTDSSNALQSAWSAACAASAPATVYVPSGTFLVEKANFSRPCTNTNITIQIDGTLLAPSSYTQGQAWLLFYQVGGVSILGGTIDGQGASLWSCKRSNVSNCPDGARSLDISNSHDIEISGLTSVNSELFHMAIDSSRNVRVQGVKISAPGDSPNTDGIHVHQSSGVTILESDIGTGDDCISVGPGVSDLYIEQITCGPGHGISIGSLGWMTLEPGVSNVTVNRTVFTNTTNGLRIKTWARSSDGFVKGVVFENATMQNVRNPILISQNYCPHNLNCPGQTSGVQISDVAYREIQGSSATPVAVQFDCSPTVPCRGIELQNINLAYGGGPAQATCQNAAGNITGFVIPPSCLS
ncbi:hypothetical protein Taro_051121 [Colocasia esculenta]|uniref:Exopolygalacturonase n=1 Tax=Colocasia esculenta TaxID=4460 RepID=A0A843XFT9_COLES|nr:hypothetical protein [Colocasia esculenta]